MASKNIEFTARLKGTIKEMGLKPPGFAEKASIGYSTLMNYLKKGAEGHVPEWDQLVKISKASGKTIDWLLTGHKDLASSLPAKEDRKPYSGEDTCNCPKKYHDACSMLKEILDSDDEDTIDAINYNLRAFRKSIKKDATIRKLIEDVEELRKAMSAGRLTDIDAVASSNIGKRGT